MHLVIVYRNFMGPQCHVGLGVNGLHSFKVLRQHGVQVDLYGVREAKDIVVPPTATHVVIEAPWVGIMQLRHLIAAHPSVQFIVRAHSQISFLQVEPGAIHLIRQMIHLEDSSGNFALCANTRNLAEFIRKTYHAKCLYLPNLYNVERGHRHRRRTHDHRSLRIGSFGALRLLKNHTAAAAAALLLAERRRCDLEFWVSVNREENPGAKSILHAIKHMFADLPWAKVVENPWQPWSEFSRTVGHMDLCMQPSFTETFNLVTADAAAACVPSVVSESIDWVPRSWKANPDCAEDIARAGNALLNDPTSGEDGLAALEAFVAAGVAVWLAYLS